MNKKIITAIAVFMVVCMMFAACTKEEPVHNHTFDSTKWVSDATMHWHAATCEHSNERADIQGHIDEDIDGVCDVCAYAASHTHAFEEEWRYDATNHWHASTCFHNVIDGSAAHTADEMGFCSVCGYKVSNPDVGTVDQAIDVGVAQKETIKHGNITTSEGAAIDFEYRNGYLYVKEGTTESFYMLTEDDQVFAVVRANAWGEVTIYRDTLATTDNLEGPVIPNSFINNAFNFYGTEDLVSYLYEMASVDNSNGDFAESVADGVYTFSFGYYIEYYGLYVITVEFTLDETTYAISSVNVESKQYNTESIDVVTEATADMPATYAPKNGVEANYTYTLAIKQGIDAENPFKPSDLLATGFDLVDDKGNVYNSSFNLEQNENLSVYIGNLVPDTAMIEFIMIEVSGENVNLDWSDPNWKNALSAYAYEGYISLSTSAPVGTVFTLNVSVNGVVKTYTVTVAEPVPSSITVGVMGEEYGNTTLTPTDKLEMEQGANETIGAFMDKAGEIVITVSPETTLEEGKYTTFSMYDLVTEKTVKGVGYNLSGLPAGEYVFTFTCGSNKEITGSITVTVKEKAGSNPDVGGSFVTPTGTGVQTDPFIMTQSGTYKANVAAGSEVFFAFTATQSGTVKFDFTSKNNWMYYGTYNFMLCDKSTQTSMTIDLNAGQTLFMKVSTYDGSAGEVTFTITLPGAPAASQPGTPSMTGSGTKADPYVMTASGKYVATVAQNAEVFYTFKAPADGQVTLTFEGEQWSYYYGTFNFDLCNMGFQPNATFSVKAGDTIYLRVGAYNATGTVDIAFTITVPGAPAADQPSAPALSGTGVQADPFIITQSGDYKANVTAGSEVFFSFTATQAGTIKFDFTSKNNWMYYGTYNFMLCDKSTQTSMTIDVTAGQTLFMKVSTYDGSAGEVTFTITVPSASEGGSEDDSGQNNQPASGSGTKADPYTLTASGKYVATVVQDGEVFYTFKVTKDGKITLNFEGDKWAYEYGTFNFDLCNMGFQPSVTFDVKAGDTVYIKVGSYNADGTVDITFTFTVE